MSEAVWLPGLLVLGAGLLIGLSLALRLRKSEGPEPSVEKAPPDLQLRIRDLEARRDDLYRRIRAAEEDKLGADEIAALEDAAALTLRELDRLVEHAPAAGLDAPREKARPAPPEPPAARRNPLLVGFAFGAAMVAVVLALVYLALRNAQPAAPMAQTPTPSADTQPPHQGQAEVPPELAAQINQLQVRLASNPEDWQARKELALSYVATGQFFEAFGQASEVLQQYPEDPDALLVHGIVRLTMGQAAQAVTLLDRVLAEHPDHRQALIYRGLALYQTGRVEQALDTWDMGLQMAGGSDPELEELIRRAQSGALQPPATAATAPPPSNPAAPSRPAAADATEPTAEGFSLTVELASGARAVPQATLFVFLRPAEGGPPIAARRISTPTFPLAITLGQGDSMMGGELPASGVLVARLDTDGNVATAQAGDLEAEIAATKGRPTSLTLRN